MTQHSGLQMTQSLNNFLQNAEHKKYATKHGTNMHALLQQIVIDDIAGVRGDPEIVSVIQERPELRCYFCASARTEVPIAGIINGIFISRRIDRLLINKQDKTIVFLDYKTDMDSEVFQDKYKKQLTEYARLLHSAYPEYNISGFILWTQNWCLEKMISL